MSFDGKTDNSNNAGKNRAGFADLPLTAAKGDEMQPQGRARDIAAPERDSAGQTYSSGAFPALNIAYPGHDDGAAADFAQAGRRDKIGYSSGENRVRLNGQGRAARLYPQAGNVPQPAGDPGKAGIFIAGSARGQNINAADTAARSEQIMADRHYPNRDQQGGRRSGSAAGGRQSFSEDMFRSGAGGDIPLQPASFSPSDYDYDYNPAAEAYPAREAEMQRAAPAEFAPQYSAPQQGVYAPADDYAPQADYSAPYDEYGYQPAQQQQGYDMASAGVSASGPAHEGEYSPHAGADDYYPQNDYDYADDQPHSAYAPQDNGGYAPAADSYQPAQAGRAPSFAETRPGDYQQIYDDYGAPQADYGRAAPQMQPQDPYYDEGDYPPQAAPGGAPSAGRDNGLPFGGAYPEEDVFLADDYDRLENDAAAMDNLAHSFPPAAGPARSDNSPAPRRAAARRPEAAFPGHEEEAAALRPEQQQAEPLNDAVADNAYDDEHYDWMPPAVDAGAAAQERAAPQKRPKSHKLIYTAAAVIIAIAAALGLYFKYGQAITGSNEPVVIRKTEGDYKVKAEARAAAKDVQEQSVSDGVSGAAAGGQKTLVNKTEMPVEEPKAEERSPFTEQKPFNQSEADDLVNMAMAQSVALHIVPKVKVGADGKIISYSAGGEKVLIPAISTAAAADIAAKPAEAAKQPQIAAAAGPRITEAAAAAPKAAVNAQKAAVSRNAVPPARAKAEGAGGFFMQISSQPSRAAAESSLREAKRHLGADLADRLVIVPANIAGKGTYYRVRLSASSREQASSMCDDYKRAGGHCFVAR